MPDPQRVFEASPSMPYWLLWITWIWGISNIFSGFEEVDATLENISPPLL